MSFPLFSNRAELKIAMVAGEASGDLLASHLIDSIRKYYPNAEFAGIGGPRMEARGLNSFVPQEELAVRGYAEVLKSLPRLLKIRKQLRKQLIKERPDVFIGVDAPDFNLGLEAKLKGKGIPTVHYVSPSVWAWRPERVKKIGKAADHILCLFPMEPPIYQKENVPATFVGHPLAAQIALKPDQKAMRQLLGLPLEAPIFALLPGSRQSELMYMTPILLDTARLLLREYADAVFVVPLATKETIKMFDDFRNKLNAWDLPIRKLIGHAQMAMIASDVVLVTSGTATLEVALVKKPMVITYKLSQMTYRMVKRKIKLPYVGLPNILNQRFVVPELLQHDATPNKLAEAAIALYNDKDKQSEIKATFTQLHESLLVEDEDAAAKVVLQLAGKSNV